tara:strand:- start:367 stop:1377 length:1011 start_codon:yes stop_codon:yes gene_type:complete
MSKTTKEITATSPELQKSLDIINSLKIQVDSIGEQCLQITIMDDSTLMVGQQNLSKANSIAKSIEDKRKEVKEPYLAAGKLIDSTCAKLTEKIEEGITHIKNEVKKFEANRLAEAKKIQDEINAKAKIEADKIAAEEVRKKSITDYMATISPWLNDCYSKLKTVKDCDGLLNTINTKFPGEDKFQEYYPDALDIKNNFINLIENKKVQLAASANISDAEQALLKEKEELAIAKQKLAARELEIKKAEELAASERLRKENEELAEIERKKAEAAAELTKTKGVRYLWKFELVDIYKVPAEWLTIDETKIKEYIKANKTMEEAVKDGIRFYKESIVVA